MRRTARALSVAALAGVALGTPAQAAGSDPAAEVSPGTVAPGGSVSVSVTCDGADGTAPATLEAVSQAFEDGTVELQRASGADGAGGAPVYRGTARISPAENFEGDPDAAGPRSAWTADGTCPAAAGGGGGGKEWSAPFTVALATGGTPSATAPGTGGGGAAAQDGATAEAGGAQAVEEALGSGAGGTGDGGDPSGGTGTGATGTGGGWTGGGDGGWTGGGRPCAGQSSGRTGGGANEPGTGGTGPGWGGGDPSGGTGTGAGSGSGGETGGTGSGWGGGESAGTGSGWGGAESGQPQPGKSGPTGREPVPGGGKDGAGNGSCEGTQAPGGVQAGAGGTFSDSVPALVAGGLLIAGAAGGAVYRLRRRPNPGKG